MDAAGRCSRRSRPVPGSTSASRGDGRRRWGSTENGTGSGSCLPAGRRTGTASTIGENPEVSLARSDVSPPMSFPADDLTKHAASLRALARDLLADDGLADDAVQQACVTALTRPPAGPVVVVAWLRAVVRSCALDLWRAEQRRRRRERRAARAAAGETPDAAEQLELQQDIVAAVRSLEEPYRTAIWLRYYEHRSPAAIAQALGEPIKTVKTRLWRALQLLRQKLDRRYGERRAWFTALAPLSQTADTVQGVAGIAGGGLLMHGKSLVVAGVLLVLVITGGTLWWPRDATAVPLTSPSPPDLGEGGVRGEQAAAGAEPIRQAAAAAEPTSPFGSLLVRVRWHDRTPAPDVAVDCLFGG